MTIENPSNVLLFERPAQKKPDISPSDAKLFANPGVEMRESGDMSNVTQYQLDAKLEAVEARADARMSRFEERIDQAIGEMRRNSDRIESAISGLKSTTIVTAISSAIAIVFGIAAFNATVLSNMVASFESGKNTMSSIAESAEQLKRTQEQLQQIQKALEEKQGSKR